MSLSNEFGDQKIQDFLFVILVKLTKHFQVTNQMPAESLNMAVELIIRDYYWYGIEDLKVFSEMAVMGKFENTYNRFDVPTIFRWLQMYDEIRTNICETKSQLEASQLSFKDNKPRSYGIKETDKLFKNIFKCIK